MSTSPLKAARVRWVGGLHPAAGRRGESAFTMVEIALCIAIVAFALVAIVGVLPTGVEVQKSNREDTIINLDGSVWLNAIRSGARGLDELTNYVDSIEIKSYRNGAVVDQGRYVYGSGARDKSGANTFTNGMELVGLLSTPKFTLDSRDLWLSNTVVAYVRALSGLAFEKPDSSKGGAGHELTFQYRLTSELSSFSPYPGFQTNFHAANLTRAEQQSRSNLWVSAVNAGVNFYDLRLTFDWPLYPGAGNTIRVGKNHKVLNTMVSGVPQPFARPGLSRYYLMQPNTYLLYQ